jgi:hypothetical protein
MKNFITDRQTTEDLNLLGRFKKDSVINIFDRTKTRAARQELEDMFQSEFHKENTNFMVSGTLKSLYADSMDNVPLLSVDEKAIQQTSIIIPKARPYWNEKN